MKSLMVLWKQLADELAGWCHTSATLDYKKLERRVKHEGDSFLTITLPKFAKSFERSLELGKIESCHFDGFAFRGGLPLFLEGFLSRVFERGTGVLLEQPCIDSIFAVRQLTMLCGKMLDPCSDARERAAMLGYVQVDKEVEDNDKVLSPELLKEFERMSLLLWADVLTELDREVWQGELVPRHGPGSTADGLLGNQKYRQVEWTVRMENLFPYLENVLPNPRYYRELDHVTFLEPDAERPVKVIPVSKTLKTPRIIAVEPTCMQFMQQAIARSLIQKLESTHVARNSRDNVCAGFVGFRDQDPNREMAREGSRNGLLATLDMSEASDRVSNQHVRSLLRWWPHVREAVDVTRSRKADVPGHGVISLSKFASMGSALCFPIEAMVFTTVCFMGIQEWRNTQLTRKDIKSLRGQVRVYGDDIIVPADSVAFVIRHLEAFGLKVNADKSFWNGKFRESCGGDFYDGDWVTPIRVRRRFPSSRKDAEGVISLVSLRNQFYLAGLWQTARMLDGRISALLGSKYYPTVHETSPLLGRLSVMPYEAQRIHNHFHSPLVQGYRVVVKLPKNSIDSHPALMKWFLKDGDEPFFDENHLLRSGRPRVVGIKRAWGSPF